MSMLEINAAKIKAEKEVLKLKDLVKQKDGQIHSVAAELVATRKHNTALEGVVADLQAQLAAKDQDCTAAETTVYVTFAS